MHESPKYESPKFFDKTLPELVAIAKTIAKNGKQFIYSPQGRQNLLEELDFRMIQRREFCSGPANERIIAYLLEARQELWLFMVRGRHVDNQTVTVDDLQSVSPPPPVSLPVSPPHSVPDSYRDLHTPVLSPCS